MATLSSDPCKKRKGGAPSFVLPRLYAILHVALPSDQDILLVAAQELAAGGVTLLQYRNKSGNPRQMLEQARELKKLLGGSVKLIMNHRLSLRLAASSAVSMSGRMTYPRKACAESFGPTRRWESPRITPSR